MFCKVVLFVSFLHWVGNELHLNGLVENSWSKYETSKYYNTIHSNNTLCCNKSFVQCSILLLDVKRQLVKYICKKIVHERFQAEAFQKEEDRSKVADCLCPCNQNFFKESDWPAKLALFSLNYPSSTF